MRPSYGVNDVIYDTDPCMIFKVMKGESDRARYINEPVHYVKELITDLISLGVLIADGSIDQDAYVLKDQKGQAYQVYETCDRGYRLAFIRMV